MALTSNQKKAVYISVSILGGLAFIFGVAGTFNGVKQGGDAFKYALDLSYCTWPTSPAAGLGIAGCFLILAAQITSNASGGCVCCCAKHSSSISGGSKTGAIVCLIFSWILTLIASVLLFVGGVVNSGAVHMTLDSYEDGIIVCHYPGTALLLIGGIFSLLATGLSLIFFRIISDGNSLPDDNVPTTGYPSNYNVQLPTYANNKTSNDGQFAAPPPAAAAAFHAPQPGSYQSAIPVASHAGYY